jgi:hypothetical protein
MAGREALMTDFTFTSPKGQKYTVKGPEGATEAQAFQILQQSGQLEEQPAPAGKMERIGQGLMDPVYGAAQIGARMTEPGEEIGGAILGDEPIRAEQKAKQLKTVDTAVQEREKGIQAKRPPEQRGTTDWLRLGGSVPTTMALAPPVLGGIPGAVAAGAMSAAIQPEPDTENFGKHKAADVAIGGGIGGVAGLVAKPISYGVSALGKYIAREYPDSVVDSAVRKILKRMGQDEKAGGPTAQGALDLINAAGDAGKPMTLADVGGENVKALAGNVSRQQGESRNVAQQFLTNRDTDAGQRIESDIARYIHGGETMHRTTEALIEGRSAAARPLWDEVRQMQGVWSPRLQEFIQDPSLRAGMARGYEIERLESLAENRPFDPTQMGIDLDADGNVLVRQTPNMRVLHMGKMGLDAMIAEERNEITGRLSQRGVALDRVRRAYLAEIDGLDQSGTYRNARNAWEGPSASMDAVRAGRAAFSSSPAEIAAEFNALSPANQEFYRVGIADNIREKLMKTGVSGDEAKSIIKNRWMRDQMRPIFRSDADFNGFVDAVTKEGQMFSTKTETLGGPQTAKRLAEDTSNENTMFAHGAHFAEQTATGKWLSAARTAVRMWRDRQDKGGNAAVNEQVARILFQTPIDEGSEIGQRLTGKYAGPPPRNPLGGVATGVELSTGPLSVGAGSALGQPGAPP